MQHTRSASANAVAVLSFPELIPWQQPRPEPGRQARSLPIVRTIAATHDPQSGRLRASVLSFMNMHHYGDLLVNFMRARKRTFIDRLNWTNGAESDGLVSGRELRNVLIVSRLLFLPRALSCH